MLPYDADSVASVHNIHVFGSFGFWEWMYRFPDKPAVVGCDFFEFADGKIRQKNAFRKTLPERQR